MCQPHLHQTSWCPHARPFGVRHRSAGGSDYEDSLSTLNPQAQLLNTHYWLLLISCNIVQFSLSDSRKKKCSHSALKERKETKALEYCISNKYKYKVRSVKRQWEDKQCGRVGPKCRYATINIHITNNNNNDNTNNKNNCSVDQGRSCSSAWLFGP